MTHPAAAPAAPCPAMCPATPPTIAPLMHPLAFAEAPAPTATPNTTNATSTFIVDLLEPAGPTRRSRSAGKSLTAIHRTMTAHWATRRPPGCFSPGREKICRVICLLRTILKAQNQAKKREGLLSRCSSLPDQTHQEMHLSLQTRAEAVDAITFTRRVQVCLASSQTQVPGQIKKILGSVRRNPIPLPLYHLQNGLNREFLGR